MIETRLDIAFSNFVVSRFAKNPLKQYTKDVKRILQYFKGIKEQNITYRKEHKLLLEGYSNSNWAGNKESRKSIFGYIFMFNEGLVSCYSKKQSIVALSSTKTKYIILTVLVKEVTWL